MGAEKILFSSVVLNRAIGMVKSIVYLIVMKTANIAEFRNKLGQFIALVEKGAVVQICKRNIPIARLIPIGPAKEKNRTKLGCGLGSARIKGDLTEPMMPEDDWKMLK